MRCTSSDFLFRSGRLFQEYICLAFTTIESQRLKYQRDNQKALRADTFKSVRDIVSNRKPLADKITPDDHSLLQDDNEWDEALAEGALTRMS